MSKGEGAETVVHSNFILGIARPAAVVTLPSQHRTIILAMDVSGSMRAVDVEPNRLSASQAAAKAFVAEQPSNVRIGVVSFAGTAAVVQMPTHNRDDIIGAIDRFQLQRGTAIGSGIIVALATLFPDAGIDVSALMYGRYPPRSMSLDQSAKSEKKEFKPVPPGSYSSAAIILLTDGQRTTGPDSIEAARMAADRGASSPSASAPKAVRPSGSKAGRCAYASTRTRSKRSPT